MPKPTTPTSTDRPILHVPHPSYQPSAKELRDDLRLKGQFEDAVKALVSPVRVRQVMPPKTRGNENMRTVRNLVGGGSSSGLPLAAKGKD